MDPRLLVAPATPLILLTIAMVAVVVLLWSDTFGLSIVVLQVVALALGAELKDPAAFEERAGLRAQILLSMSLIAWRDCLGLWPLIADLQIPR